jgi:hypothetical protein
MIAIIIVGAKHFWFMSNNHRLINQLILNCKLGTFLFNASKSELNFSITFYEHKSSVKWVAKWQNGHVVHTMSK